MKDLPQRALAEAIGTFFLCFAGVAAICTNQYQSAHGSQGMGLIGIAVAHGLALSIGISALGKVSGGHFNPAVSITMVVTREMPLVAGILYVFSQLVGGTAAGFAAKFSFPHGVYESADGGVPVLAHDIPVAAGIFLEAVATFFLLIAVFGTAVDRKAPAVGGFGIGLTVLFDILAIGPLTGASMNPARTFGPGLAAGIWSNHYVYWVGPIAGGVVAGIVYKLFFISPAEPEKPVGSGID